jgi:succinylarginine dihydrolase
MSRDHTALVEACFDGIVGPTHSFAGLSPDNPESHASRGAPSNPRAAALQGLAKMATVRELGGLQAVLPPAPRPDLRTLRRLGFSGRDEEVIARAGRDAPELLATCSSASSMWAANAATVIPSTDSEDGRAHVVVANLAHTLHRSLEARTTELALRDVLRSDRFVVHPPLPASLGDEGAANHLRLTAADGGVLHLFAWGRQALAPSAQRGRQAREASEALARLGRLPSFTSVLAKQSPRALEAGAFHTDLLAASAPGLWWVHEAAFDNQASVLAAVRNALGPSLRVVEVSEAELPLAEALSTFVFNTQLVTAPDGSITALVTERATSSPAARAALARLREEVPAVREVRALDVGESLRNGGGPACLRLRVPLAPSDVNSIAAGVWLREGLERRLRDLIARRWRDRLVPSDLADPALARESLEALDELTAILGLGSLYDFQQA